jgi:hypothetical protein
MQDSQPLTRRPDLVLTDQTYCAAELSQNEVAGAVRTRHLGSGPDA